MFISMKPHLKDKAMQGIEDTNGFQLSKNRIQSMVEIDQIGVYQDKGQILTIFINKNTGEPLKDEKVMER